MYYALIDESGRLYDPNDKILVFGAVVADNLTSLEKIILKARKRIPKKGKRRNKRLSEIKFSLTGDKTRLFVLKDLAKQKIKIYVLIVDKQGRKIQDTPENYGLLLYRLLEKPLKDNLSLKHVLVDKHFTFITQREKVNNFLQTKIGNNVFVEHVDSLQNPVITIADFVAGAIRFTYIKRSLRFKEKIENLIAEEKYLTWTEIKKR